MLFKDIVGQQSVKKHLISMVREERISHAQLFTGPPGAGQIPLALAFAQYVNCKNPGAEDACGECSACKKMSRLVHPDLHFVFPVVKKNSSKPVVSSDYMDEWRRFIIQSPYFNEREWFSFIGAERGQGMIYTQEGNEIIKKLNLKTFEGKYKVMIIWQPEKMHNFAANKLLKILEEPPPRTLFVLVSDYPAGVLPTILSRTQQLKIPKIDEASLAEALKSTFGITREEAETAARISRGNFIEARDIISNSEEKQFFHDMFASAMRNAFSGKLDAINDWVDRAAALPREQLKNLLLYCIDILRESYIANYDIPELVYATPSENKFIGNFKSFVNDRNVQQMVKEYELALAHIEQNGNAKLVLFDMSMKISGLFRLTNNLV
ncbi:MAG: polymerase subunit delta [Anaerophaga sp.]|uniref:DNA polymerase III subunit n=1 Tax=Anaerophaga thermohalophila TaxID=177400 RepID=UPI0002D409DB|nr:DNA polymerase III subunit [Anaerophaga thermohalophila]MBZ4675841.1 polymerase subunit delta [Anaerophaga sp.]MDI3520480.1 polymerase subunit delta [Anaerophaga sp.]MDK2840529.1 polymerase subunit delta [Anaerophaga sp.]